MPFDFMGPRGPYPPHYRMNVPSGPHGPAQVTISATILNITHRNNTFVYGHENFQFSG